MSATSICTGCHTGDFPEFDHYVDVNQIEDHEVPAAFGAWVSGKTGWDGGIQQVEGDTK